jgi:Fe(3+) dicitrate transport protein
VGHRLIVGARAMADIARRRLSRGTTPDTETGDLLSDDTTSILGLSGYVQDRIAFRDNLLVTPGVRVEHSYSRRLTRRVLEGDLVRDVELRGSSQATGVMPGLGFAAGRPALNLFWGVHSGYSPPRVSQSITPTGQDAGLSAERSMNYELGVRARPFRWLRTEGTGFVTAFDNQLVSNNTLSGTSAEFKNGGKTRHLGAEITAIAHLGGRGKLPLEVDVSGQYTYVRSTFVGGPNAGNFVPYSPEHTLTATVDAEHRTGIGAQVSISRVGQQFADETNAIEPDISGRAGVIPSYSVLDLGARYRHKATGLSFHLNVKNVLDDVYLSSRLPNGIFTSGFRQIIAGIKWSGG